MEARRSSLISDANLQAYYLLEDATDFLGTTDLTETGTITYSSAKYGNGARITATASDYLSANSSLGVGYNDNKSISLWYKPATTPALSDYDTLVSWSFATGDVYYYIAYENNSGTLRLRITRDRWNVSRTDANYNVTLSTTEFSHIVGTWDSSGNMNMYLNNSLVAGPTAAGTSSGNNGAPDRIAIGTIPGLNERFADGTWDDVLFFDKVLSTDNIDELYRAGSGGAGALLGFI